MALPAISARKAAATSIWPRWPRSAWMRGSNGVSEPLAASVASAPVTSAAWNTRSIANRLASASAVENWVPLSSASPSFGPSAIGASPARASAAAAGMRSPACCASPMPSMAAARCASGARSPDAPTEPWLGITGIDVARQHGFEHLDDAHAARRRRRGRGSRASAPSSAAHWPAASARRPRPRARARCCAGAWRDLRTRCARWRACRSRY